MLHVEFLSLVKQLKGLTAHQRLALRAALDGNGTVPWPSVQLLNERNKEVPRCPRCASERVQRWGKIDGLQRFRCTRCRRTFNPLTGTPLARLRRRDVWLDYAEALQGGLSIRKAARRVGVHYNTTFRWRHRWLQHLRHRKDADLAGIVEVDETFFLESFKGSRAWKRVAIGEAAPSRPPRRRGGTATKRGISREQIPVLVARDRSGATTDAILPKVDGPSVSSVLDAVLDPRNAVLCTDGLKVYRAYAQTHGVTHRVLTNKSGLRIAGGAFHIQNVNAYHSRLKDWMRRFRGVSTKYLESYLGWRRLLDRHAERLRPSDWLGYAVAP